jgi:hypothetical protein
MNSSMPIFLAFFFTLQLVGFGMALHLYLKNAKAFQLLKDINANFAVSLFSFKGGINDLDGLWHFLLESAIQKVFEKKHSIVKKYFHSLSAEFSGPENQSAPLEPNILGHRLSYFFYQRLNIQARIVFYTRAISVSSSLVILAQFVFSRGMEWAPILLACMALNLLIFSTSQIFLNQQVAFKIVAQLKKTRINLDAWSAHSDRGSNLSLPVKTQISPEQPTLKNRRMGVNQ